MLTVFDVFDAAQSCGDHPLAQDRAELENAVTIVALGGCSCGSSPLNATYDTCGSYCDTGSFAVAQLADGSYFGVEESSDTSGHGCRCSGSATVSTVLDDVVRWLSAENREAYLRATAATQAQL